MHARIISGIPTKTGPTTETSNSCSGLTIPSMHGHGQSGREHWRLCFIFHFGRHAHHQAGMLFLRNLGWRLYRLE